MYGLYTIILRKSKDGDKMEHVLYNGKKYIILYKYTSGFCEIKEVNSLHNIQLVHLSELTNVN
jgi:hypothetical protein